MKISPQNGRFIEHSVGPQSMTDLHQALDRAYQKMRESARARWETLRAGQIDPSDACVSVRVSTAANSSPRTAGLLRSSKATPSLASVAWSMVLLN